MKRCLAFILAITAALALHGCKNASDTGVSSHASAVSAGSTAVAEIRPEETPVNNISSQESSVSSLSSRDTSDTVPEVPQSMSFSDGAQASSAASGSESPADTSQESSESSSGANPLSSLTIADIKPKSSAALIAEYGSLLSPVSESSAAKNGYDNILFRHDGCFLSYDDPEYDPLLGIDVSSYQGDIDWEAVRSQGISFVFVQAGYRGYAEEGTLNEDLYFRQNIEGAKAAGLMVGAYFFSQAADAAEAEEEAAFALQLLDGISLDLPLVFDAEYIKTDDARTDSVLLTQFTENALAFCRTVESAGYSAMIYSNLIWQMLIYDMAVLSDYPIWYAGYYALPRSPYDFEFWQYSETGSLDGVEGYVDMNIWMRKKAG